MTDSNNIIVKSNVDDYGETSHLLLDNNTSNDYDAINEAYFEQPSVGSFMPSFGHVHYSQRAPWLRAAILGLNDGLVSTSSTMLGVGGGSSNNGAMFLAGVAALVAGSLSMACGEYVSVSSQKDAEEADLEKEREEHLKGPLHRQRELEELRDIYIEKGLSAKLATEVAQQLTTDDIEEVVRIHARDELGININSLANPLQASIVSAFTFFSGGIVPFISCSFIDDFNLRVLVLFVVSLLLLLFGAIGAILGGAPVFKASMRVLIGGIVAMAGSFGIGKLFNVDIP
jgi:VIT1/CCC1 family predicted Fe2+/Mn2+ transporter